MFKNPNIKQYKIIFRIGIPIVIAGIIQQTEILINSAFLGRINTEYFAAVGNSIFPFILTLSFFWSVNTGTTVLAAQKLGAGKKVQAARLSASAFKFNTLFSLAFFLFWIIFPEQVFHLMGVREPILSYSVEYIRILSFVFLFVGAETTAAAILQAHGKTFPLFISGAVRSSINLFLSWVLIFGHFGFAPMEIRGAGIALVAAEFVGAAITISFLLANSRKFGINLSKIVKSKFENYKNIARIGIPSGLEEIMWHFGNLIIVRYMNSLGPGETGIYTLVMRIEVVCFLFYSGFAKAAQTLAGHASGAGKKNEAARATYRCLKISILINVFFMILFGGFAKDIVSIFTKDSAMINSSYPYLIMVALFLIPKAFNVVIGHGIRGIGDTKWMLYTQIFGTVFVVVMSYIMIFPLGLSLTGVYITWITDEFVRAVINTLRFAKGRDFFLSFLNKLDRIRLRRA
ncbi:MAG TPA: MATE family efflux transporter [Spirochaetota bacterium]|jgi:putative MATE family efflux protein|nr:MATE family efflux transporter [Spirochaetota bacterium]HOH37137.1 MATE family efflux transporter [Spirochaetota bacterium]HPJ13584.1 MATE family efflux transporter [Spirochaetota bacterium]HPM33563.1 MATE family efflux transporter [Spirochaetota bacterium]HPW50895.1 MATE family efflux transporter [Spirochaetota bacterium]